MMRLLFSLLIMSFIFLPINAEEVDVMNGNNSTPVVTETYKLKGVVEYDDNEVETIYLDENIEKPQINIQKRSLTLPISMLNITSNTDTHRSALARASINRNTLKDILPFSGSVVEQLGGFSYGQYWEQEVSPLAHMTSTTAFFVRYDTPKLFSFTTSVRQAANYEIGTHYNQLRLVPEWHITDRLTLKDSFTNYMNQARNKNELTLVYRPALKKYAESLKFELGVAQTYYQNGNHSSAVEFTTDFKL